MLIETPNALVVVQVSVTWTVAALFGQTAGLGVALYAVICGPLTVVVTVVDGVDRGTHVVGVGLGGGSVLDRAGTDADAVGDLDGADAAAATLETDIAGAAVRVYGDGRAELT